MSYLSETSSILLNINWYLLKTNKKHLKIFKINSIIFYIFFFIFRIINVPSIINKYLNDESFNLFNEIVQFVNKLNPEIKSKIKYSENKFEKHEQFDVNVKEKSAYRSNIYLYVVFILRQ